jgi:hypothetical protein
MVLLIQRLRLDIQVLHGFLIIVFAELLWIYTGVFLYALYLCSA